MAWEIDWTNSKNTKKHLWARNLTSKRKASRQWHSVPIANLRRAGIEIPQLYKNSWEADWAHPENTGTHVWARNPDSRFKSAREWHFTSTGELRRYGINTPVYRKDSWEIDWDKRKGKKVWARNLHSKMPKAREWHWIDQSTLYNVGIPWKPKNIHSGRSINSRGYIVLTRMGMTDAEIKLAEFHNLFRGKRKNKVLEHQLMAVKKYGSLPKNCVVRHKNGIKTDNSPENLLLGTTQENTMDHNTARLLAIYWREQYEIAQKEIEYLKTVLRFTGAMVEDGRAGAVLERALMGKSTH